MAKAKANKTTERPEGSNPRAADRPPRVPMTGQVDILTVGQKDPKHKYRWFADDNKGRLQKADAAWWDHVSYKDVQLALGANDNSGDESKVRQRTGTLPDGQPQYSYLMRIPKKFYDESQKAKQELIASKERTQLTKDEEKGQYGEVKLGATRSS